MTASELRRFKHLGFVLCSGLLLSLPVLLFGFPYPAHDSRIHDVWYSSFVAQFWGGEWYPRWLQNLDGGLGGPTFYFYPPVPYWITSLLQPPFLHLANSWRILGVSAALALLFSGASAYGWLRQFAGKRAACVAAILYMAMPYHFAIDLHARGAFGEIWSFVWMPLILLFAFKASPDNGVAFLGLALAYALLIMTHLPTVLMFSIIPLIHVVWTTPAGQRTRRLLWVAAAMGLGVGLSAIFLLPALLEQGSVRMDFMRTEYFYYENNFFLPHPSLSHLVLTTTDFARQVLKVVVYSAGVGACAWLLARRPLRQSGGRETAFWGVVGVGSLLLMFPVSKPVYEAIAPLQLIQFPWRFSVVLSVAIAALMALGFDRLRKPYSDSNVVALVAGGALLLQCFLVAIQPLRDNSFSPRKNLTGPPDYWKANNFNTTEYRPRWGDIDPRKVFAKLRPDSGELTRARVINGAGAVVTHEWQPRLIVLGLDGGSNMVLEVSQFYYPNWVATVDGTTRVAVDPSAPDGLVRLTIPAGSHTVELRFARSKSESTGGIISLFCSGILLLLAGMLSWRRWKVRKPRFGDGPARKSWRESATG